jgi:hypothetical protein
VSRKRNKEAKREGKLEQKKNHRNDKGMDMETKR